MSMKKMFRKIGNTQNSAIPKSAIPKIQRFQNSAISKMTLITLINDSIIFIVIDYGLKIVEPKIPLFIFECLCCG